MICIDPDPASYSFTSTFVNVRSICMGMEDLLDKPNAINLNKGKILITLNQVLEHFEDPLSTLLRLTQSFGSDFYLTSKFPSLCNLNDYGPDCPAFFLDHRHIFSSFSLAYTLQLAGISVLHTTSARTKSGKTVIRSFGHFKSSL